MDGVSEDFLTFIMKPHALRNVNINFVLYSHSDSELPSIIMSSMYAEVQTP